MTERPSTPPRDDRLGALVDAAHAIGALDAALGASPVARFWHERAAVVGLADCLALAGATLTPAEFFRGCIGLVEPVFFADLDRELVSLIVAEALPDLAPGSMTTQLVARLQGSSLLLDDEWTTGRRPTAAARTAVSETLHVATPTRADVGTALPALAETVAAALATLRAHPQPDWHSWLIAARLPTLLARTRITASALPCLTGLTRGMRYSTAGVCEIEALLLPRFASQARDGLAMLRRLEACAQAWRARLDGLTARSRAGQAAGLFLVWPACTRPQLAAALDVTPAGAGTVLEVLIERGIVERQRFGGVAFYVARESLGEFKLEPRQGRHPALPSQPRTSKAFSDFDAEMSAFDLLGISLDPASIGLPHPTSDDA